VIGVKDYLGDAAFPDDTWTASTPGARCGLDILC
jgi:hypothetical protein